MNHSTSYGRPGHAAVRRRRAASWTDPWTWTRNPWHPLLLIYAADYYPIDFGAAAQPNWTFARRRIQLERTRRGRRRDGRAQRRPPTQSRGGVQHAVAHPGVPREQSDLDPKIRQEFSDLLQFVQTHDNWDLLSQALDGFNQQLLINVTGVWLGSPAPRQDPTTPWSSADRPCARQSSASRHGPAKWPVHPSSFLPWRCGQFVLTDLAVVDEWGQAVWPIAATNYMTDTVYMPPEMKPAAPGHPPAPPA